MEHFLEIHMLYSPLHLKLFDFHDFPEKLFQLQSKALEEVINIRQRRLERVAEKKTNNLKVPLKNSLVVDMQT
jgi:hypothetical protein